MVKAVELDANGQKELLREIKEYFLQERDEDLSDFQAENLLRFILHIIGPAIYNQGIFDAHRFMGEKLEDMLGLEKRAR